MLVAQPCPTLCDPIDCGPKGFSVHGILQARILEWVAIPFSSGSSQGRDWIWVSCTAGSFFAIWATKEALQRQDIEKQLQGEQHWLGWGHRTSHHLPVSVAASEGPLLKRGLHGARPSWGHSHCKVEWFIVLLTHHTVKNGHISRDTYSVSVSEGHLVVSDSLQPHGLYSPWNSPGHNTGVDSRSLLHRNLPNPGIEPRSPTLQADSLPAEPPGKPKNTKLGSLFPLQWIFLTQESNWGLLHCSWILYQLSYQGSPRYTLMYPPNRRQASPRNCFNKPCLLSFCFLISSNFFAIFIFISWFLLTSFLFPSKEVTKKF